MFLDEPTTGLDSSNAAKVVDILAGLGRVGVTVVMSIHQPRPGHLQAAGSRAGDVRDGAGGVLGAERGGGGALRVASVRAAKTGRRARGGLRAGHGTSKLGGGRGADDRRFRRVLGGGVRRGRRGDARGARVEVGRGGPGAETPAFGSGDVASMPRKYRASFGAQVRTLWSRMARNVRRHPFLITLHFVATGAAALSIGAIFWNAGRDTGGIQNRMGSMFFMLLYLTLMSLSSLPVWREDRLLFLRERASGAYGTRAYFTSVVCFDILVLRVAPLCFSRSWRIRWSVCVGRGTIPSPRRGASSGSPPSWCSRTSPRARCAWPSASSARPTRWRTRAGCWRCSRRCCAAFCFLNAQGDNRGPNWATEALTRASFVNYAFDALLINEFLDAGTFQFTPKWNDANGKTRSQISVDVTGRRCSNFLLRRHHRDHVRRSHGVVRHRRRVPRARVPPPATNRATPGRGLTPDATEADGCLARGRRKPYRV